MKKYIFIGIFLVVSLLVLWVVRKIFAKIYNKKRTTTVKFFKSLTTIVLLVIITYTVLSQFEATKDVSKTLLQSGSLIIALATFSGQKVLGNLISGLVISSVKPFNIGDKIILMSGGQKVTEGVVIDINTRHTTIRGIDDKCSMIPNGVLDEMIIINANTMDNNGYALEMECSFDSDVNKAIEIMQSEIDKNELTLNGKGVSYQTLCAALTANGYLLKSIIWTKNIGDNFTACSQLRISICEEWKKNGIAIPYQTITIENNK